MKELVDKICKAINEIGAIPKNGYNKAQNYHYRAHCDIMSKLQGSFANVGLVFYPKSKVINEFKIDVNEKTFKKTTHVIMTVTYAITDGQSTIEFMGVGEGVDWGDKASYKAQTGAAKYALNDILLLPSEMDPEGHEAPSGDNTKPKQQPPTNKPAGNQPPSDNDTQIIDLCKEKGVSEKIYLAKAKSLGVDKVLEELRGK